MAGFRNIGLVGQARLRRGGVACWITAIATLASATVAGAAPPAPAVPPSGEQSAGLREIKSLGDYVHAPSGLTFPVAIGPFWRAKITEIARDDLVVSYQIERKDEPVVVMAVLYNSSVQSVSVSQCAEEFEAAKALVTKLHPGAVLVNDGTMRSAYGGDPVGHHAMFEFTEKFAGVVQPLQSQVALYCLPQRGRMLKFRATAPATDEMRGKVAALIAKIAETAPAQARDARKDRPGWPDPIVVRVDGDPTPLMLLGVIASGEDLALKEFEGEAEALGFKGSRAGGKNGEARSLVVLPLGEDPANALLFWNAARAGKFKGVKLEAAVAEMRAALAGGDIARIGFSLPLTQLQP